MLRLLWPVAPCAALALPGDAQWEYVCRADSDTPWFSGNQVGSLSGFANVADVTGIKHFPNFGVLEEGGFDDGYSGTAPVGTYRPNPWGLFDVHGNVWEWCEDAREDDSGRVLRGGGFGAPASGARCAVRSANAPSARDVYVGVRAARGLRPRLQ